MLANTSIQLGLYKKNAMGVRSLTPIHIIDFYLLIIAVKKYKKIKVKEIFTCSLLLFHFFQRSFLIN